MGTFLHVASWYRREDYTLYGKIAKALRARIARGDFEGKLPLPSEVQIMDEFECSRDTARRAIALLRDEGLVETIPQIGTFVREAGDASA